MCVGFLSVTNGLLMELIFCYITLFQQAKAVGNGGFNEIMEATLDYNEKPTASSKM